MHAHPFGPHGATCSRVGCGGMHISIVGRPNEETALRVIHSGLDHGVTLLDTADVYCLDDTDIGHNETLFAKALRTWSGPREQVLVATKGGMTRPGGRWERDARPASLVKACERSLRALATDCIDLYQLHAPDPQVPFEDSVGALAQLREHGKIHAVGLSNVSVQQVQVAQSIAPITSVQNRLSPFFREALDTGVVEYCEANAMAFMAYSPVGGGRLNTKLPNVPELQAIASTHNASAHEVVLAWVLSKGPNVFVIPSARSPEHAASSVRAAEIALSHDEITTIDHTTFSRA